MKKATTPIKTSSVNLLMIIFFLISISEATIAGDYKNLTTETAQSVLETNTHIHCDVKLPNDLDSSTRKKLKTAIEKKLMIKINKVLDNKNNITLNAIEVTVDVNGIVAVTKVKGKNLPQNIIAAITSLVEKQDYSKFKMLYFWKYVIEF